MWQKRVTEADAGEFINSKNNKGTLYKTTSDVEKKRLVAGRGGNQRTCRLYGIPVQ